VEGAVSHEASYLRNTAIVQTIIRDGAGNALSITDFTPRFKRYERVFNPAQIFRRIEPLAGLPRVKIRVRPTFNYGGEPNSRAIGSNHMRFAGGADTLRVTTDAAITYLAHETSFGLAKPVTLISGMTSPSKQPSTRRRASSWSEPRIIGSIGCARSPFRWNIRRK